MRDAPVDFAGGESVRTIDIVDAFQVAKNSRGFCVVHPDVNVIDVTALIFSSPCNDLAKSGCCAVPPLPSLNSGLREPFHDDTVHSVLIEVHITCDDDRSRRVTTVYRGARLLDSRLCSVFPARVDVSVDDVHGSSSILIWDLYLYAKSRVLTNIDLCGLEAIVYKGAQTTAVVAVFRVARVVGDVEQLIVIHYIGCDG